MQWLADLARRARTGEPRALKLVPESVAEWFLVSPLREDDRTETVATADPTDLEVEQALGVASGHAPVFAVAAPSGLLDSIDAQYSPERVVDQLLGDVNTLELETVSVVDVGSVSKGSPLRVVIVDDSVVMRQRLVDLLEDVGGIQVVGVATDGHEGLEAILTLSPDVVILDIRMPGMSNIELMDALRHRNLSPILVVLADFPYPAYRKRCQELGAQYFFDKSTELPAAVEVLQALAPNGAHRSSQAGQDP